VPMIRALAAAGASLMAVNKENQIALAAAEKLKNLTAAEAAVAAGMDADAYRPSRNSRDEVIAALRELMHLGPNDPVPAPPAVAAPADKKAGDDKEKKDVAAASAE
jgi:hypothetical protein